MPVEISNAIDWAIGHEIEYGQGERVVVSKETMHALVDKVREFFNINNIGYSEFSYKDLKPYI